VVFPRTGAGREERHCQQVKGKPAACYLVIFDRRPDKGGWEERLFWSREGDVTVLGC
jgi:hypothetical protein